jgi:hypothetical protein
MFKRYEVEWGFIDKRGYCCTKIKAFENAQEQQKFAFEKYHEKNVYEVRQVTETIWRKT